MFLRTAPDGCCVCPPFMDQAMEEQRLSLRVRCIQLKDGIRECRWLSGESVWPVLGRVIRHFCPPSIGQNSVTCSHEAAREAGKCSLARILKGKRHGYWWIRAVSATGTKQSPVSSFSWESTSPAEAGLRAASGHLTPHSPSPCPIHSPLWYLDWNFTCCLRGTKCLRRPWGWLADWIRLKCITAN